jgi:diguanylate cyclase (GGDEF)-like protein
MKNKILQSIGVKIFFFYSLLSIVTITFIISIIFENQVDLISKNIKLESERQLSKLITSMKKFTHETQKGTLIDAGNYKERLNQIIKFITPHFDDYMIFSEKKAAILRSSDRMDPPKSLNEDGIRSITAKTFSGDEYYLRINEEKKILYCYIPLSEFQLGNSILLLQKDISSLNEYLKKLYHQAIYITIVVLLFHIIFAIVLFRYIVHPITLLNNGAKKLSGGDFSARISIKRQDEFSSLAEAFNKMAGSIDDKMKNLSSQVETAKDSKDKIENLAIRDELTGLYNHNYIIERTNEELKRSLIKNRDIAFLLIDLDHFNEINKIYGHQTGNIILTETAKAIVRNCQNTDVIARFGGEEFGVLLPECSVKLAQEKAEQIRSVIEKNIIITPDREFSTTVSIGISYVNTGCENLEGNYNDLPGLAEKALLHAKESGRNKIETMM